MSMAFGLDFPSLERELSALITAKKLNARIDSERQVGVFYASLLQSC
jgi:hypothetical protein